MLLKGQTRSNRSKVGSKEVHQCNPQWCQCMASLNRVQLYRHTCTGVHHNTNTSNPKCLFQRWAVLSSKACPTTLHSRAMGMVVKLLLNSIPQRLNTTFLSICLSQLQSRSQTPFLLMTCLCRSIPLWMPNLSHFFNQILLKQLMEEVCI